MTRSFSMTREYYNYLPLLLFCFFIIWPGINEEILDLLNEESVFFLKHAVVALVYKFDEKSTTSV